MKPEGAQETASVLSPTPPPPTAEFGLTLAEPDQNQVFTETPITLSGITQANAWLAVSAEEDDYLALADEDGAFEQDVDLVGGVNEIIVTAFSEEGYPVEEKVLAVYSSQFGQAETDEAEEEENE